MVDIIARALAQMIRRELKHEGVMFKVDKEPLGTLRKYITSLEKNRGRELHERRRGKSREESRLSEENDAPEQYFTSIALCSSFH